MDIIEKARELGKLIQQEESYIALQKAQADADADMELQNLIGDFNMKRMSINNEASKKDKDSDKLALLNSQMREDYSKIMSNKNMIAYNDAKDAFDVIANRVLAIVQQSAEGADPETADYSTSSCSGSCSTCGGCG
ncbi:YlbF family regulator [Ruminococcus sp.]|uniref:YlbF family regulator n=1 Tax=Ruminococcus sp. TaxID=41978 RepID=UPI003865A087